VQMNASKSGSMELKKKSTQEEKVERGGGRPDRVLIGQNFKKGTKSCSLKKKDWANGGKMGGVKRPTG